MYCGLSAHETGAQKVVEMLFHQREKVRRVLPTYEYANMKILNHIVNELYLDLFLHVLVLLTERIPNVIVC